MATQTHASCDTPEYKAELTNRWNENLKRELAKPENQPDPAFVETVRQLRESMGDEAFETWVREFSRAAFGDWLVNGNPYAKGAVFK